MQLNKLHTSFTWKPQLEIVKFICISLQQSVSNFGWKIFGYILPKNKMLFDIPLESFVFSFALSCPFFSIRFMLEVFEPIIFVQSFVQRDICFSFFIIAFQVMDSYMTTKFTPRLGFTFFLGFWSITRSWGWVTKMVIRK